MDKLKLFFSYSHSDKGISDRVRALLEEKFLVLGDHQIEVGQNWANALSEQIKQADYFIIFLSPNYLNGSETYHELHKIIGYIQNNSSKAALPILISPINFDLPSIISHIQYLNGIDVTAEEIAKQISSSILQIEGRKVAEKEKVAERIEKINISIVTHIEPILEGLKVREYKLRRIANTWNFFGYIAIILGIIASITLVVIDTQTHSAIDLQRVLFLAIKGALLLILLLTSSKYAFTLSKSYMNESLKNADRMHAIEFGKFYIKVFENSINPNDFKEIFQNWNLSKDSSFSAISADNYDPKIADSVVKVLETIKDMAKK